MLETLETLAARVDELVARLGHLEADNQRLREELAAERQLREAARQRIENILNKLGGVATE